MTNSLSRFEKTKIALEYYLIGKEYFNALKAFQLAREYHVGTRKDGVTPEFNHQIEICHYILTLKDISNQENAICVALLHDIREDYEIEHSVIENMFWKDVADAVELVTKKFKGVNKSYENYFESISWNEIASIVKGADRINNVSTMIGVFSDKKQLEYVSEVETLFLPMLKKARKNFPKQTYAYLNMETILRQQVMFVKALHSVK